MEWSPHPRRSWKFDALIFLAITLWSLSIYRNNLVGTPRADQYAFLHERTVVDSDWDFFFHVLSMRTQLLRGGDYFLYRPAMHAVQALYDILIPGNLYILGVSSILWHAGLSFALYFLLSGWLPPLIALPITLAFTTQHAGVEMILWRHISPYMIGMALICFGLILLSQWRKTHRPRFLYFASLIFFVATLFHESIPISLPLWGLLSHFLSKFRTREEKKEWFFIYCLPSLLFFLMNGIDLGLHAPSSLLSEEDLKRKGFSVFGAVADYFRVHGIFALAFWFPHIVTIRPGLEPYHQWDWDFSEISEKLFFASGCGMILLSLFLFVSFSRRVRQRDFIASLGIFFLLIYGIHVGMISIGRVSLRGVQYLTHATYHYYINSLFLWIILSIVAYQKKIKWMILPFYLFVCYQTVTSYKKIQVRTSYRQGYERILAEAVYGIDRFISQNPQYCYLGPLFAEGVEYARTGFVSRRSCALKEGIPVYVFPNFTEKRLVFYRRPDYPSEPVDWNKKTTDFSIEDGKMFSRHPSPRILEGKSIILTKSQTRPKGLSVVLHNRRPDGGGAIVLGYKDRNNFSLLSLEAHPPLGAYWEVENGSFDKIIQWNIDTRKEPLHIEILAMGENRIGIFENGSLVAGVQTRDGLLGLLGLYDIGNRDTRQYFTSFQLNETFDPAQPNLDRMVGSFELKQGFADEPASVSTVISRMLGM